MLPWLQTWTFDEQALVSMHLQLPGVHLPTCSTYTEVFEEATATPSWAEHEANTCTAAGVNIKGGE